MWSRYLVNGIQAYLGDTGDLVPRPCYTASIAIKQVVHLFAGEGSCLQVINNTMPVKCDKAKCQTKCASIPP